MSVTNKQNLHVQVVPFSSKSWLSAQAHTRPPGIAKHSVLQPPLFTRHILSPAKGGKWICQRTLILSKVSQFKFTFFLGDICRHKNVCIYIYICICILHIHSSQDTYWTLNKIQKHLKIYDALGSKRTFTLVKRDRGMCADKYQDRGRLHDMMMSVQESRLDLVYSNLISF